jgi:hypothetical protein
MRENIASLQASTKMMKIAERRLKSSIQEEPSDLEPTESSKRPGETFSI